MFTRAQQNRVKFDQGHHPVHFAMSSQAKTHHAGLQKNVGTHWKLINIITGIIIGAVLLFRIQALIENPNNDTFAALAWYIMFVAYYIDRNNKN